MVRTLSLSLLIVVSLLTSGCLSNPHSSLRPRNHRVSMKRASREWSMGNWFNDKRAERQMRRQAREWEKQMAHQPAYQPIMGPGVYNPMMNGWGNPAVMAQPTYFPATDVAMMDMGMMNAGMMNAGMMDPAMMGMMSAESGDCGCGMSSPMMDASMPMGAMMDPQMMADPSMGAPMMGDSGCGCGGGSSAGLPMEFHQGGHMTGELIEQSAPILDPVQKPATESAGPANAQPGSNDSGLVPMPVAPQT